MIEKHVLESGGSLEGNNKVDGEPSAVFGNTESGELKMISVSDLLKLKSVMKELAAKQEEEKGSCISLICSKTDKHFFRLMAREALMM